MSNELSFPLPGDSVLESYNIKVRNRDYSESFGQIVCYVSGMVVLTVDDSHFTYWCVDDVFHALCEIRLAMEKDGKIPLVNGANRHALVTGMAISMGGGYRVYLNPKMEPLGEGIPVVDTFGSDYVTDPVYVSEQDAFRRAFWQKYRTEA